MCVLAPPRAAAQTVTGAARVTTVVDACVPIDIEQFHRVLAIELGTSIQYSAGAAKAPDAATIHVSCSSAGITLQLSDSVTRKSMSRAVELPQVEVAARTRLLALTVAEFVVASWVELQLAKPPIEPVGPPVPPEMSREASQVASRHLPEAEPTPSEPTGVRWLVGASAEPILFSSGGGLMPQLSLHTEMRPGGALAVGLSFGVAHGEWDLASAGIATASAQLTASSGRLSLAYVTPLGPLELLFGAGARLGLVHMAGRTNRLNLVAVELYAPWGGPILQLSAAWDLGHLRLGLELEAGYVSLPVQALIGDNVVAELGGAFGSLGLRLGWLF